MFFERMRLRNHSLAFPVDHIRLVFFCGRQKYLTNRLGLAGLRINISHRQVVANASNQRGLAILSTHRPIDFAESSRLIFIAFPSEDIPQSEQLPILKNQRLASVFSDGMLKYEREKLTRLVRFVSVEVIRKIWRRLSLDVEAIPHNRIFDAIASRYRAIFDSLAVFFDS
jgi:hypothetical protein